MNSTLNTRRMVLIALFAALTGIGAFISFPLQPIPFTLQPFFIFLAGMVLDPFDAFLSQAVYLAIGAIGIPVYSGMTGGVGHLFGPTGGFLFGFMLCSWITAIIIRAVGRDKLLTYIFGGMAGMAVLYLFGVAWLGYVTGMGMEKAFTVGALPFLLFDFVKLLVAAIVGQRIWKMLSAKK